MDVPELPRRALEQVGAPEYQRSSANQSSGYQDFSTELSELQNIRALTQSFRAKP